jgi:16S rRNA (cytosine967-C5)-methyltransferase
LVKEGGILVYAVCSLEPEEGEKVVQGFLEGQDGFVVDPEPPAVLSRDGSLLDGRGFFKSLPQEHDMDGFFAVRLKRA